MRIRDFLIVLCLLVYAGNCYGQGKDTFEVHFPFNISKLSKESTDYIDKLVFKDFLLHGDKLIVLGYADFVGGKGYNDTLSRARATTVRNYLVSSGFDERDIKLCIGKGKIDRTNVKSRDGYAPDRKVQIIIDREEMAKIRTSIHTDTITYRSHQKDLPSDSLDISKLEVNGTFSLNNIFFKLNQPVLLPTSEPDLQKLLVFMQKYPGVRIQIEGHVCCMGNIEGVDSKYKGRFLSELRAEAIYTYLVSKGINKDRMKYVGLANRNPVVRTELTEEDKQKNRRVEIRILSK